MSYEGHISNAQDWHVYFFGGYELKELSLISDLLKKVREPVALDVGANLGGHSLVMAKYACEVHAFEPYGPLADSIDHQAKLNGLNNIRVHRYGLGETNETKSYFLDKSSRNVSTGSFFAEHAGAPEVERLLIRQGDEVCQGMKVDFIKIDVEGYEGLVLRGLKETLAKNVPYMMMEVTNTSWEVISRLGGLKVLIPYPFEVLEICNPQYYLGVFQLEQYRIKPRKEVQPRSHSFNILIMPISRVSRKAKKASA
jgi:FkbM family methyltransferase